MALMPSHTSNLRSPAVFPYCISPVTLHCLHSNHRLSRLRVSIFCVSLFSLNVETETLLGKPLILCSLSLHFAARNFFFSQGHWELWFPANVGVLVKNLFAN